MQPQRRLSLRARFAISMAVAFVALCLFLVLFINLAVTFLPGARLLQISLLGLFVAIVGGGGSAYWLAGVALRPLRGMQAITQHIHSETLHTRIHMTGPFDELRLLADTFDTMLDRLERAFAQQAQFVADAAHELRTPLATLRINLEVVSDNPQATLEEYRLTVATCERALTRLEHLVRDLLLLATEGQEDQATPLDLAEVALRQLHELRPVAERQGMQVGCEIDDHPIVHGNATLLGIVARNLLDNALRYNRPEGTITLALSATDTLALLEVADTGMGIPSTEHDAIFQRFYRLDSSRARNSGGFGLGLALARHIVEQSGGTISVVSEPGQGSRFRVCLPRYSASVAT